MPGPGSACCLRSPYLRKIGGFHLPDDLASTVLYFHQGTLVREFIPTGARGRHSWDGSISGPTSSPSSSKLSLQPASSDGSGSGWPWPSCLASPSWGIWAWGVPDPLGRSAVFRVLYRAGRYSIARPAREVLFTVVDREERYKSKASSTPPFIGAEIW